MMDKIKQSADLFQQFRDELGFVNTAQCKEKTLITEDRSGEVVGAALCNNCVRKPQTTLYDIAVKKEHQNNGIGTKILKQIARQSPHDKIIAKCPHDLDSNQWYENTGWELQNVESGKNRKLNVWRYDIESIDMITTGRPDLTSYAEKYGWLVGTRIDSISAYERADMNINFLDLHWEDPDFDSLITYAKKHNPKYAVAGDYDGDNFDKINAVADRLSEYVKNVIIVPHNSGEISKVPQEYIVGYSTPSGYAETNADISEYFGRDVHILGGTMNQITNIIPKLRDEIVSIDTNTHHRDATQFGEYWSHTVPQRKKTWHIQSKTRMPYKNSVLNMTYKLEEMGVFI